MKNNIEKKEYKVPVLTSVCLDNEIALALQSSPPTGPGEVLTHTPDFLNNDPFYQA